MRTLSAALLTAQQNTKAIPYIKTDVFLDTGIDTDEVLTAADTTITCDADATTAIPVNSVIKVEDEIMTVSATGATLTVVRGAHGTTAHTHATDKAITKATNYWTRLLYARQIEQPYLGFANIVLENHDRALDSISLHGCPIRIGYGHYTNLAVVEPNGDNSTHEYSYAPELWVKEQSIISVEGESVCELYCEDAWAKLRETKVVGYGTAPYYAWTFSGYTVEALMGMIIEDVMGWTLNAPATSDGIVDVYKPEFSINNTQPETAAEILYRLIGMTKSYLRVRYGFIWDIVYPQTGDSASRTLYSNQVPYFKEYQEKVKVLVPNSITVFANNPTLAEPWPEPVMTGTASDIHAVYGEIPDFEYVPEIVLQADADNRAVAILTKILAEKDAGRMLIPHDSGMELYDKVSIVDERGF